MSELKDVYAAYAAFGVPKGGVPCFASKDFVKFVKDAGFWRDKGNQFNTKPPNRVDFVYTYAATNGPGGKKGNKLLSYEQFEFALEGVAKELGEELGGIKEQAVSARPRANATSMVATRFHDDKSAYTGAHKLVHSATEAPLPKPRRGLAGAPPQTPEPPRSAPARGAPRSALRPQSAPPRPAASRSQAAGGPARRAVGLLSEKAPDVLQGGLLEPPQPPSFSIRNAEFFHARGVGAAARGDLQSAIQDYDKALSMGADASSRSFKAHLSRALLLDRSGLHEQAVHDYSGALSALQHDEEATLEVQDASEAQLQLEQLQLQLELQPATSTSELLFQYHEQQQPPQGRLPAKAVMLFNRASSLYRQGAHRAAVADLDEALALAPLRADFYQNRALARRKLEDFARAVDDYRIAAAIRSGALESQLGLGGGAAGGGAGGGGPNGTSPNGTSPPGAAHGREPLSKFTQFSNSGGWGPDAGGGSPTKGGVGGRTGGHGGRGGGSAGGGGGGGGGGSPGAGGGRGGRGGRGAALTVSAERVVKLVRMLPPSAFEGTSLSALAADARGLASSPAPVRDAHGFADTNRAASCLAALRRLTRQPEAGPMSELEAAAVSDFIFESGGRNRTWLTHGLRYDGQRRALAKVATLVTLDEAGQIYAAAEAADRMYILLAGSVQLELPRHLRRSDVRSFKHAPPAPQRAAAAAGWQGGPPWDGAGPSPVASPKRQRASPALQRDSTSRTLAVVLGRGDCFGEEALADVLTIGNHADSSGARARPPPGDASLFPDERGGGEAADADSAGEPEAEEEEAAEVPPAAGRKQTAKAMEACELLSVSRADLCAALRALRRSEVASQFAILREVPALREWSDARLRRLARVVTQRSLPRGTALVTEGQPGSTEELFFLVRGGCRAERTIQLPGGGTHTSELCLLWPKDLAGELGLLERNAPMAEVSVVADTAVEVLVLPKRHFDVMLADDACCRRTIHLIQNKYEARYPPAEVLVRRHHAAAHYEKYKNVVLDEVRRTRPGEGGRGKNASAIFGKPAWARQKLRKSAI